jgi:hypothetical protein
MSHFRVRFRRTLAAMCAAGVGALIFGAGPASAATATVSSGVATGTIVVNVNGASGYGGAGALAISACGNADAAGNPLPASAANSTANCFGVESLNIVANGATVGGLAVILSPVNGTNYTINYTWANSIGANGVRCVANGNFACRLTVNAAQLDQTIIQSLSFPLIANVDTDTDGVLDDNDNCVDDANADQADTDGDGTGDACEPDTDGDGVIDDNDNCPNTSNADQADADEDGIGDACANDTDGDGVSNADDNCPSTSNADQTDTDGDGDGDVCDDDDDGDGVLDAVDNCPLAANPDQVDADGDGFGTECDENGDVAAVTTTAVPTTTATPTTTVATQVQGAQQLAVTGFDEAPAIAAALALIMMGLGMTAVRRGLKD